MKILITGGNGFIGSNLIIKILKNHKKFKILNLDCNTYASNINSLNFLKKYKNYKHVDVNICNFNILKKKFINFKPDIVLNLAAETHVDNSIKSPKNFIQTNIIGTYNLLEISRDYIKNKKNKFLFFQISTDEVYGDLGLKKSSFKENSLISPSSPYSASKASGDHLVNSYFRTYKLPTIITRCTNNYGPYQSLEKLIPKVISNALNKKEIPVYNKGNEVRDWIHVADHAEAIIKLIKNGKQGNTYNIGSKNQISNIKLIKKILFVVGKKNNNYKELIKLIKFVKDRPGHDYKYSIDNTKIKSQIKWKPKIKFDYGIEETIDWYTTNRKK
jgi:dTDP-glucose 4,6-dehydratase